MESQKEQDKQVAWSREIPDYGNKLLKRLDEFRKTTILYDVRVRARDGDFNAHKVILAACGGIFRTCFVDEEKKMINDTRELQLDCPANGLKTIIRFAYTGSLVVTKRNAVATMIAAEVTKMKEAQDICADIAFKEYGWVVNFSGEKTPSVIEHLGQVLRIHTPCFNNEIQDDVNVKFPFTAEVEKEFAESKSTYLNLAMKLNDALKFIEAKNSLNKTSEDDSKKNIEAESAPLDTSKGKSVEQSGKEEETLSKDSPKPRTLPPKSLQKSANTEASNVEVSENVTAAPQAPEPAQKTKKDVPPRLPTVRPPSRPDNNPKISTSKLDSDNSEAKNLPSKPSEDELRKNIEVKPAPFINSESNAVKSAENSNKENENPRNGGPKPPKTSPQKSPQKSLNTAEASNVKVSEKVAATAETAVPVQKTKKDGPPPLPRTRPPRPEVNTKTDGLKVGSDVTKVVVNGNDVPDSGKQHANHKQETPEIKILDESKIGEKEKRNSTEENGDVPLLKTPQKLNPCPSPKVKPRSSVKVKKAPAPPPSASPVTNPEKKVPPRPSKPAKLPPPRPKPPTKKLSTSEADTAQKAASDYDDSLNPFA